MTLRLIEGPGLPVTVAEAKANSRIETDEDDALIEDMIRAALAHAEMWCGRAFEAQTWEQVYDEFPTAEIALGVGPVISVVSVQYDDVLGNEQEIGAGDFDLDSVARDGWLVPHEGFSWPTTLSAINAVRIRFIVGDGATADVRRAILLLVEHWYNHRGATSEKEARTIPFGVEALLNLHRRLFV